MGAWYYWGLGLLALLVVFGADLALFMSHQEALSAAVIGLAALQTSIYGMIRTQGVELRR